MLAELIKERMWFMYGDISKGVAAKNMPHESLGCGAKFYEDFASVLGQPEHFQIVTFHQIGMFDPFPAEIDLFTKTANNDCHFVIPMDDGDLVYAEDRYMHSSSPKMTYYPSRMMLFQLMRACVGVKSADNLWF